MFQLNVVFSKCSSSIIWYFFLFPQTAQHQSKFVRYIYHISRVVVSKNPEIVTELALYLFYTSYLKLIHLAFTLFLQETVSSWHQNQIILKSAYYFKYFYYLKSIKFLWLSNDQNINELDALESSLTAEISNKWRTEVNNCGCCFWSVYVVHCYVQ